MLTWRKADMAFADVACLSFNTSIIDIPHVRDFPESDVIVFYFVLPYFLVTLLHARAYYLIAVVLAYLSSKINAC